MFGCVQDEKRVRFLFDACNDLLSRPLPAIAPEMGDVLV
jgi:hypothetical protein